MQVKKGRATESVKLTFGERSNERIFKKIRNLVTTRGIGRKITRKIYSRKKPPLRAQFLIQGGYSKRYVQRVYRKKGIELPQYYTISELTQIEMAITPRNVLDHLNKILGGYDGQLEEFVSENHYNVGEEALEHPRIRAIEIMYHYGKD